MVRPPTTAPSRPRGRPRRPDVEQLVLDAAIDLLTERGLDGTTMNAVIERSGMARATVYLRWPNRQALITAAVRQAMGRSILVSSGNVETDIRLGAARMGEILESTAFRSIFPAVVAGLTGPATAGEPRLAFEEVAPGAQVITDAYREGAAAQGFRRDVPPQIVLDLVIGGQLGHYLATGEPPDQAIRDQLTGVVLDGLRRRHSADGA
jgi:AcrR family transcriptional regulator